MKFDLTAVDTVGELAHSGAQNAAASLGSLTGETASVEVTNVDLVPLHGLAADFEGEEFVGVTIEMQDAFPGTILLAFSRPNAERLTDAIIPDTWEETQSVNQSGVREAANIMVGGFVKAWADHFGIKIGISAPEYIAGAWPGVLPEAVPQWDEQQTALSFTSHLQTGGPQVGFRIYMFPEPTALESVFNTDAVGLPIPVDKLSMFNAMTNEGSRRAADKLTQMTDMETEVEISQIRFVPRTELETYLERTADVAAVAPLQEQPHGVVAVLFNTDAARVIGDALLPMEMDGDDITPQHVAAIEEIANIMTSGFIDGWANTMGRTIQHTPPEVVTQGAAAAVAECVDESATGTGHALLLDSTIRTDGDNIEVGLLTIPQKDGFRTLLEDTSVDEVRAAVENPEQLEPPSYTDIE